MFFKMAESNVYEIRPKDHGSIRLSLKISMIGEILTVPGSITKVEEHRLRSLWLHIASVC